MYLLKGTTTKPKEKSIVATPVGTAAPWSAGVSYHPLVVTGAIVSQALVFLVERHKTMLAQGTRSAIRTVHATTVDQVAPPKKQVSCRHLDINWNPVQVFTSILGVFCSPYSKS